MSIPLPISPITGSDNSFDIWFRFAMREMCGNDTAARYFNVNNANWRLNFAPGFLAANNATASLSSQQLWCKFAAPILTTIANAVTSDPGDTVIGAALTTLAGYMTTYAGSLAMGAAPTYTITGAAGAAPTIPQLQTLLQTFSGQVEANLINAATYGQPGHNATLTALKLGRYCVSAMLNWQNGWFNSLTNSGNFNTV